MELLVFFLFFFFTKFLSILSRSCMFVDGYGRTHEVESEDFERSKVDPLGKTLITNKDDFLKREGKEGWVYKYTVIDIISF